MKLSHWKTKDIKKKDNWRKSKGFDKRSSGPVYAIIGIPEGGEREREKG